MGRGKDYFKAPEMCMCFWLLLPSTSVLLPKINSIPTQTATISPKVPVHLCLTCQITMAKIIVHSPKLTSLFKKKTVINTN